MQRELGLLSRNVIYLPVACCQALIAVSNGGMTGE